MNIGKHINEIIEKIETISRKSIDQYGYFNLGVTGGRSTSEVYQNLKNIKSDFSKWQVILLDERWVPEDHPDSNSQQIRQVFFDLPNFKKEQFISFHHGRHLPQQEESNGKLNSLNKCHITLLGVGEDGHICGLFPKHLERDKAIESLTIVTKDSPKPPSHRISVSYSFLKKSEENFFLIFGEKKKHLLDVKTPLKEYPFSFLKNSSKGVFFTDQGAL